MKMRRYTRGMKKDLFQYKKFLAQKEDQGTPKEAVGGEVHDKQGN